MYPSSLPNIDLQVLPTFPAHVGVTGVLTLVKSGLSYTFGVNFQNVIEETNVSDMSKREVLVQDTDTGAFWRVKLTNLPTGQTDWANIQNKPATFPPSPHTHPVAEISDATVTGQSLVTAVDAAAARAAIGAVNKAGDAMTGTLRVPTTLFVDAGNSSANAHLRLCDETGVSRGTVYWARALDQVWVVLHDATGALVNSIRLSATGATIGTSPIWTDANKQIADGQVLGNVSGSTGVPVGVTLSALLDKISNTRGAVLYRGASGWAALGAGAAGQVLTSGGAGADPSWQNTAAVGVDALIPQEFVAGLTLSNNAGDPNNKIDIAPGRARGSGVTVEISSTITKRLDANWSEGNGGGGLDTGSKAANATYHVFVIRKDDDGTGDVLLSTSATSPTVPVGWTRVQRLGAIMTDGSGNIRPFVQSGNKFFFNATDGITDYSGGSRAKAPLTCTMPNGVRVEGLFSVHIIASSGDTSISMSLYDGENPNIRAIVYGYMSTGVNSLTVPASIFTSSSRQIQLEVSGSAHGSQPCVLRTLGWIDYQIPRIG